MKYLVIVLVLLGLAGYLYWFVNQGAVNKAIANRIGSTDVCIDGVRYLQFPTGASVKYNPNGTIATCN